MTDIKDRFKFKKVAEETFEVTLDNKVLGQIAKGWSRIGGTGWVHSLSHQSFKNRKDCAFSLHRELVRKHVAKR